jgi:hypothetical protein
MSMNGGSTDFIVKLAAGCALCACVARPVLAGPPPQTFLWWAYAAIAIVSVIVVAVVGRRRSSKPD